MSRDLKVWMRAGDQDDYHSFDCPEDAAYDLAQLLAFDGEGEGVSERDIERGGPGFRGIEIHGTAFVGHNGVSLFWGDDDAQIDCELSDMELEAFWRALIHELGEYDG